MEREPTVRDLLRFHEGERLKAYRDKTGNITIGVGRNLVGKGISQSELDHLLDNDIFEATHFIRIHCRIYSELTPARQAALVDMYHNLGPGGFLSFKKFLIALNKGNFQIAANEMRDSRWYRDHRDWQGENNRVERLARMIETGFWPTEIFAKGETK